ncbi:MAG TPA: 3-oxoacyl-ACP reductase family protein [Candidatus Omnitrophota bacterium]|nr:3-oxoacyl-ACP reductase family protein [Candidatus Omnitrophota bacterium]HPD85083.1 3-oxoacyl-ACP reductase family protein [Candidatus Omnitrophota bacterium]HRZ03941.1 3-oxoacyl-ACP reductase family protein [Candidatus Omnitrophota bacterium]
MSNLKDKVAIVTGGSRGIGRAIVLMLAQNGCHVAFSYQKSEKAALDLVAEAKKLGVKCMASKVDVRDFVKVKAWVEEAREKMGHLDILVNNAGIIMDKALMLMEPRDWQDVIDTNLTGVFNVTRACIVGFLKQKSGDVINISSVSGVFGLPRQVNYSASKGGVNAFTKALAKEVAAYGIRVNAIAPGFIDTDILSGLADEQKDKILAVVPLGRLGTSQEVAGCVRFLLSENARYITGQIIQVDGGLAIR